MKHKKFNKEETVNVPFINDVQNLTNDIIKYFPKFFCDFRNFEYATGADAGKDFKKIFNKAEKMHKIAKQIN